MQKKLQWFTTITNVWVRKLLFLASPLALVGFLSACQSATTGDLYESVDYRQNRFTEISAVREYSACVDEAMGLDVKAREQNNTARYLASAQLLEKCEVNMGPDARHVVMEERMRAYALNIQNYFKGSDVVKARENLEKFKINFSGRDLYYDDGSSFIDTMDFLFSTHSNDSEAFLNVSKSVRSEMRRMAHWQLR